MVSMATGSTIITFPLVFNNLEDIKFTRKCLCFITYPHSLIFIPGDITRHGDYHNG